MRRRLRIRQSDAADGVQPDAQAAIDDFRAMNEPPPEADNVNAFRR
jgi:hypothetical protein